MAIDEAGDDGHLFGVEGLGPLAGQILDLRAAADGGEPGGLHCERLRLGHAGIHRVDLGVEDDQIGGFPFGSGRGA